MRNREGGVCWAGKFRESAVPPNTCNPTIAKTIVNRNNNAAIDTKLDSELTRTVSRKCFPKVLVFRTASREYRTGEHSAKQTRRRPSLGNPYGDVPSPMTRKLLRYWNILNTRNVRNTLR